jgi:hypothetical protein
MTAIPKIQMARQGYDLKTCASRFKTIDTTKNHYKVLKRDRVTFNLNSANNYTYSITYTHNLPYSPTVLGFISEITKSGSSYVKTGKYNFIPNAQFPNSGDCAITTAVLKGVTNKITIRVKQTKIMGHGDNFTVNNVFLSYIIFADSDYIL